MIKIAPMLWIILFVVVALAAGQAYLLYLYGYLPGTYRNALRSLGHKSRKVVISAATLLGKSKNPESVGPLIRCLKKPDPGIRKAAIEALGLIGRPAIEPLCQTFIHHDEELRFSATQALLSIDPTVSIEPLCRKLATAPTFIRRYVSEVLVTIGPDTIEPLLRNAPDIASSTFDENKQESQAIFETFVQVLARVGKKDADVLYQSIAAGDKQKLLLAQALGRIGDDRAPALLARILGSKNPNYRLQALEAMREMGDLAVPAVVDILRGKNEIAKRGAVELLVAIGGNAHRALFELIEVDDPQVQLDAAIALGRIGRVRPLITVLWPKNHVEVAFIIENGSKTKIDMLGNISVFRKAIEQSIFFGRMARKYRALYYLQSLVILLYPDAVSRIDDPRLGRVLGFGGSALENLGPLRITHIHPVSRRWLEKPRAKKGLKGTAAAATEGGHADEEAAAIGEI